MKAARMHEEPAEQAVSTVLPPHSNNINAVYADRQGTRKPPTLVRRLGRGAGHAGQWLADAIYAPLAFLLRLAGYRFIVISNPDRIGHLVAEVDEYLKRIELGDIPPAKTLFLLKRKKLANRAVLEMWERYITVISNRFLRPLLKPFLRCPSVTMDLGSAVVGLDTTAAYYTTLRRWQGRPPVAWLSGELVARARADLDRMGLPENAWYVCIHSREGGYSPRDEHVHEYRNSDIETCTLAMDEIVARGGYCIRMGDATMAKLAPRPGVIDYATSEFKSDYLDLYLCANTRFFLGNTSGVFILSAIFNVPSVLVNMIPYSSSYSPAPGDISIPKKLCDTEGRLLHFPDIFASSAATFRYAGLYREHGIGIVDNTPEEIRDAAAEMLDRLDGTFTATAEDEARQERFRGFLQPHHYCYGATSRIGRDFLRQHAALLEPSGDR